MNDAELAHDAARIERDITKLYKARDRAINEIVLRECGIQLPILKTWTDEEGNKWAANVTAKLVLVERATGESNDGS